MHRKRGFRNLLRTSALAVAVALTAPAVAQDEGIALDTPNSLDTGDAPIVVTGTRIQIPDYSSPNPIVAITAEQLQQSGETNLTEFLTGYPALVGSSTRSTLSGAGVDAFIGSTGLNLLNLRNLGVDRTLVLVNGRRHVSALPGSAAVDINTIPTDLVERVDVLTGGQSAIYGADGVTGVVNFIMRRDFEGITARAQFGISEEGDAGERLFAITAGQNFGGGRGNFAISYEYGKEDGLIACDRSYLCGANRVAFYQNPADFADDPNVPDYIPLRDVRFFDTSPAGGIDLNFDGMPDILPDGSAFDRGTFVPPYYQIGGSGTPTSDYISDILPDVERHVVNGFLTYELTDAARIFVEAKYANVKSFSVNQPSFDFYNYLSAENPFMPDAVRSQVIPGLAGALFGPGTPDGVLMNRDNLDFGMRGERIERETIRAVVGVDGDLAENLAYSLSYTYGETKFTNRFINDQLTDRFYAAIDVVADGNGNPVCRITAEGDAWFPHPSLNYTRQPLPAMTFSPDQCVPLNIFGNGAPSQAALDWITADTTDRAKITQHVVTGYVSGDFGNVFELPGGPVAFVLGGEYRKEKSTFIPDALTQQGLTFANLRAEERGSYDVKEAFAELRAPIIANQPWAQEISLGAALRLSDYDTIGSTTTWKVDGLWNINHGVTVRGTYSEAVRAPNISELFRPRGQDFQAINDPCHFSRVNNGTDFRQANCLALLDSLGVDNPGNFIDPNSSAVPGFLSGNENLEEETAKTWTAGVVFQPDFLRGFRLSLDWYDIKLENAINTPAPQDLAELCVDQPTLDNIFCDQIVREPGSGRITQFQRYPQNVSRFTTSGLDVSLFYLLRTDTMGDFNFRLVGNYLNELEFIPTPGAEINVDRGEVRAPRYQANFDLGWSKGPLTINYGLSWFDNTYRTSIQNIESNPDYFAPEYIKYKERWVHDIYASYLAAERAKIYFGIRNFTDEKPGIGSIYYPVNAVGRFFFTGVEISFDELF